MRIAARRTQLVIIGLVSVWLLSGCTDWKKKHDGLEVELQNLQGRYENCMAGIDTIANDRDRANRALAAAQAELAELKRGNKKSGFEGLPWEVDENRGTITVTLENTILFASGMAEVKSSVIPELDKIASVLQQNYRGKDVSVVGHTDTDPINKTKNLYKDNWDLSAARSLAVLRYLVKRGIRPEGIKAVAAGEFRPAKGASNSTASGKAKNRRVEIVVHMF
jgi:chemotaxis protein MotB